MPWNLALLLWVAFLSYEAQHMEHHTHAWKEAQKRARQLAEEDDEDAAEEGEDASGAEGGAAAAEIVA